MEIKGGELGMFTFLAGVAFGAIATIYGSEAVKQNLMISFMVTKELLEDKEKLREYVTQEIYRMHASGELHELLKERGPAVIDLRRDLSQPSQVIIPA